MREEVQLTLLGAFFGMCFGVVAAVVYNLHRANLSGDSLSFLGNILGAGLGASITVVFAQWVAGTDRRRDRRYAVQQSLRPIQSLIDATHDVVTCAPEELHDAMAHVEFAGERLRSRLADDDLTDVYLRKAFDQAHRAFIELQRPILKAQPEVHGLKKPRRAPADELLDRLLTIARTYERIRSV